MKAMMKIFWILVWSAIPALLVAGFHEKKQTQAIYKDIIIKRI